MNVLIDIAMLVSIVGLFLIVRFGDKDPYGNVLLPPFKSVQGVVALLLVIVTGILLTYTLETLNRNGTIPAYMVSKTLFIFALIIFVLFIAARRSK